METKATIEQKITRKIFGSNIALWRIAVTHDLRSKYEPNVTEWDAWEAVSISEAEVIKEGFIKRGMQPGVKRELACAKAIYVEVFVLATGG